MPAPQSLYHKGRASCDIRKKQDAHIRFAEKILLIIRERTKLYG